MFCPQITDDPTTQSSCEQTADSQARWRDRSSAALWIRRARPCACAWRTESHTLIRRRSAERRARWRAVQLRPQPILPSISLHEPAYLQSSRQLHGLYTLSFILSLDLGILYAAPSWCARGASLGASWATKLPSKKFQNILIFTVFFTILEPPGAPTSDKMAPKLVAQLPKTSSEDSLTYQGYLGPSWPRFWRVLGSTLCLLRPYLAPTWRPRSLQSRPRAHKSCPREPKIVQEPPKTAQDSPRASQERPRRPRSSPRAAQESPRAAQDSPRASQKPTKMPRSSPRPDQSTAEILPRTWPETTQYPRLEKNSQLHHAILQNFFPNHKAAEIKNERRRYSPPGGFNPPDHLVVLGRAQDSCDNLSKNLRNP